jgi:hypothetical protein
MSARTLKLVNGKVKVTDKMTDSETCDASGNALPLQRGLVSIEGVCNIRILIT